METKIAIFKGKQIRKAIHNNEWWFSIADVVEALTDSADPKQYIKKIRQRDSELNSYWGTICTPLEILAPDGKIRETNCANTEGIFRVIQSIPSPKAEPFKRWLAKVGYERVQEIENPEIATKRTRMLYKLKGYSDDWIEKRMRGIAIREELTDEWKTRKERIDKKLKALKPSWQTIKFKEGMDLSALNNCAVEEFPTENGPADYALFVKGKLLGIIEAKKVAIDPKNVLEQAKRYSRGVKDGVGQWGEYGVPFLYSTNGELIWHIDVRNEKAISRKISNFHTPLALEEFYARDIQSSYRNLQEQSIEQIERLRDYQCRAIWAFS